MTSKRKTINPYLLNIIAKLLASRTYIPLNKLTINYDINGFQWKDLKEKLKIVLETQVNYKLKEIEIIETILQFGNKEIWHIQEVPQLNGFILKRIEEGEKIGTPGKEQYFLGKELFETLKPILENLNPSRRC